MRCQKARSWLSAYSNGELIGRRLIAVGEHLSTCPSCRQEEQYYSALSQAGKQLPKRELSEDFNNILLNRVAHERFAETRTKAYLPKAAPVVQWGRVLPILVTACLALIATVMVSSYRLGPTGTGAGARTSDLDDSYLTVLPVAGKYDTHALNQQWSLSGQLDKSRRIERISHNVMRNDGFGGNDGMLLASVSQPASGPCAVNHYRIRPVMKIYVVPGASTNREVVKPY